MRLIDEQYLATPFYGSRRMTAWLERRGEAVNRKRVQRLMRAMGLEAIHPGPRTATRNTDHKVHPCLLRGVTIDRRDQVWAADVTYLPLEDGYMFLAAVIDWHSRFVLSWRLSNTLDGRFCLEAFSMDGRGRALDNVFVERLWRSLKYEEVCLKSYRSVPEMEAGLERWFAFYNLERLH